MMYHPHLDPHRDHNRTTPAEQAEIHRNRTSAEDKRRLQIQIHILTWAACVLGVFAAYIIALGAKR